MGFIIVVLLLLFVYFLPSILRFFLRMGANHMARKFQQYAGQPDGGFDNRDYDEQPEQQRRKKVFDKNDGEYVQFEEIKEERNVVSQDDDVTYVDDRVSDVKFEEIKDK